MPRQPGQLARPPVGDAVPGELGQHQEQEAELQDDEPEHVVAPGAAHLLVVQVEEGAVALVTLHLLRVQDDGAELLQELLYLLNVVTVTGPWVASKEINLNNTFVRESRETTMIFTPSLSATALLSINSR